MSFRILTLLFSIVLISQMEHSVLFAQTTPVLDFLDEEQRLRWFEAIKQPLRAQAMEQEIGFSGAWAGEKRAPLSPSQVPERSHGYGFFSYGNRQVGGLRMEGQFRYEKQQFDSLGWQQVRELGPNPYYFANIRRGNWNNDRFSADLNVNRSLWKDKIRLGVGADYALAQHNRSNDPRPRISHYYLQLKAQLGWQLHENWLLAAHGGSFSSTEIGQVTNYNASNDSFGRLDYNLYTMMGLGSFNLLRRPRYELSGAGHQYGGALYHRGARWSFQNEFTYRISDERFLRRGSASGQVDEQVIGDFNLISKENRLAFTYQGAEQTSWSGLLVLRQEDGRDFNHLFAGFNYLFSEELLDFQLFHRRGAWLMGLHMSARRQEREDFNASHAQEFQQVVAGISMAYRVPIVGGWVLLPDAAVHRVFHARGNLAVPEFQRNIVTREVVAPMLAWESRTFTRVSLRLQAKKAYEKFALAPFLSLEREGARLGAVSGFQEAASLRIVQAQLGIHFIH
ncbi:MAG: DUF6850 family outer membrane beta-barrel protein [Nitritalea sp.]